MAQTCPADELVNAGAAPISASDQETFAEPSTAFPVLPIVRVRAVVHFAALPEVLAAIVAGRSAEAMRRNVAVPADPLGAA